MPAHRIARLIAVIAGIAGVVLCGLVPLLPVKQTTATIVWPQAPGPVTDAIGRVRVNVRSSNGQALFVGIGPRSDVSAYLGGVRRSEVTDVNGDNITYKLHSGGPPAGPPASQSFWEASSSGTGQITVSWKVKGGTWAIVLMNANGAAPVSATVSVGANTNLVLWVGIGLLVLGLILDGAGTGLLLSSRSARPGAA